MNPHYVTGGNSLTPANPARTVYVIGSPNGFEVGPTSTPPSEKTLPTYLGVLRRRGLFLLACVAAGIGAATLFSWRQKPLYQSRAALEVQTFNSNFLNTRDVTLKNEVAEYSIEPFVQNQAELVRDEELLGRVVDRLDLTHNPNFPESRREAILVVLANLKARPVVAARVIRLSYDAADPRLAASILNAVDDEFIQQSIENRKKEADRTTEWLNRQAGALKQKLEASENELQRYAHQTGLLFTDQKNNVAEESLRSLQAELAKAQADRIAKESLFRMASASDLDSLPQNMNALQLPEYQTKLTELRRQRADLATLLTPTNYKVQKLDAQIAEMESAINKELAVAPKRVGNDYKAALAREAMLTTEYAHQATIVAGDAVKSIHYSTLLREVETTRALHAQIVQRSGEAAVNAGLAESNIRLMAPATIPLSPYKPNSVLNLSVGLLTGLFFGISIIVVQEFRDRTFKVPGELSESLRIAELGAIPAAQSDPGLGAGRFLRLTRPSVETITRERSRSLIAESFRTTLTSLFLSEPYDGTKVAAVTSVGPNEGKTTLVSNLGLAVAQSGRRVLLVNADLRQPRLHQLFGLDNAPGLADLLGDTSVDLCPSQLQPYIRTTSTPLLDVIPSGSTSYNIDSLFHTGRLLELLEGLRSEYELILIDTPPVLQIADARLIGRASSGIILVVRAGHTNRAAAKRVAERFEMDRIPILGTILNDWNPSDDGSKVYMNMYRRYYDRRSVKAR